MDNAMVPVPTGAFQSLDQSMRDVAGQISTTSQRVYLNDARHFATWIHNQGLTPATFTRSDMIAYRAYLANAISERTGKPYSKATKQRMFSVARKLMGEAHLSGLVQEDVIKKVSGFKVENETTHTALSKSQARDMLDAIDCTTIRGKRDYAILLMLVKTGLRRSELVALNRGDLRMMDGHHVAVVEHGKGDKRRVVKLRVDVQRAIDAYLKAAGPAGSETPLFVSFHKSDRPTTRRLTDKGVELLVKNYAPRGVDLTPHGLRATFVTLALEAHAPLQQVQYAAGHRDPRTTERYQKRKLNLDDNAVDVLNF